METLKNISALALEVLKGKYGNDDERKRKLGSNYAAVQKEVNRILSSNSIDDLAIRVLAGEFGSGEIRKKKLGSKYAAVQNKVNELLGITTEQPKPKPITEAPNNGLARAACKLAYSQPSQHNPKTGANKHTEAYKKAYNGTWGPKDTKNAAPHVYNVEGRSCDRSVSVAVLVSGYDDDMRRTSTGIYEHLRDSSRWKNLGNWNGKESSLMPGDILIRLKAWPGCTGNHVCMYVGSEIVKEVYNSHLKGTDADKGAPAATAKWYSGHYNGGNPPNKGYAPCLGDAKYAHADTKMKVFRCVSPQKSTKYTKLVK